SGVVEGRRAGREDRPQDLLPVLREAPTEEERVYEDPDADEERDDAGDPDSAEDQRRLGIGLYRRDRLHEDEEEDGHADADEGGHDSVLDLLLQIGELLELGRY